MYTLYFFHVLYQGFCIVIDFKNNFVASIKFSKLQS